MDRAETGPSGRGFSISRKIALLLLAIGSPRAARRYATAGEVRIETVLSAALPHSADAM
jgi:hypothetical protein